MVEAAVYDAFVEQFLAAAKQLKVGDSADPSTDLGPVVHARAADRIMGMIEEAQAAGGTLLLEPKRNGCLIEPTVIAGVPRDAWVVQEGVFGPGVVSIEVETVGGGE